MSLFVKAVGWLTMQPGGNGPGLEPKIVLLTHNSPPTPALHLASTGHSSFSFNASLQTMPHLLGSFLSRENVNFDTWVPSSPLVPTTLAGPGPNHPPPLYKDPAGTTHCLLTRTFRFKQTMHTAPKEDRARSLRVLLYTTQWQNFPTQTLFLRLWYLKLNFEKDSREIWKNGDGFWEHTAHLENKCASSWFSCKELLKTCLSLGFKRKPYCGCCKSLQC